MFIAPLSRLAPALSVLACLLAAPSAMAAGASVDAGQDRLEFTAGNGERNLLTVTGSGSTYTLEDSVSNITAGTGCTQLAAKRVRCSPVQNGPIESIYFDLRDQDDTVVNSASIDVEISAGDGADKLTGGTHGDRLYGGAGDDLLDGGLGPDVIEGDDGRDRVTYASRTAPVNVSLGSFWGDGQSGEWDFVSSSVEEVVGGSGSDTITGTSAANAFIGGPGADTLDGRDGNDVLEGGDGVDKLDAGNGDDVLRSRDSVTDTRQLRRGQGHASTWTPSTPSRRTASFPPAARWTASRRHARPRAQLRAPHAQGLRAHPGHLPPQRRERLHRQHLDRGAREARSGPPVRGQSDGRGPAASG